MKLQPRRVPYALAVGIVCWVALVYPAQAQTVAQPAAIVPGERLSDWLLRNAGPNADTTALHWQVQAERASQGQLRQAVVQGVLQSPAITLSAAARAQLSEWLLAFPLTGRLTLALTDARWLQSAPAQDPVLQDGHRVVLLARPSTVNVVTEAGLPCAVTHLPNAFIKDYLRACLGPEGSLQVDWAWVAQPDGRTARFGIAPWSLEPQDEPGPGAWIWAPGRAAAIPHNLSDNLARFLATQLPGQFAVAPEATRAVAPQALSTAPARAAQITASDWGEIGLLQTPGARMESVGAVRLQLSHVLPYTRGTVMFQPLEWLEAGFRYSDISNRLYGPLIAGNQSFKDKSVDFKVRLREESDFWPQVALGVRDIGGTGLFSGEYVVAGKRWGDWDASLGLGWGYLGSRGNVKNPLSIFGARFNTRPVAGNSTGSGGTANFQSMFRGPTALFGGLQWHAPSDPWIFKLELDGNDYQHEPLANNQRVKTAINVGAVYRYSPFIDLSLGLERGTRVMLGLTLHGGLNALDSPKLLDPVLPPVRAEAPAGLPPQGWGNTAQTIELYTGWSVRGISHQQATTTVVAQTDAAVHLQDRIERAIMVLQRDAPASSTRFVLELQERGLPMSRIEVDRAEWVTQHTRVEPLAFRLPAQQASPGQAAQVPAAGPDDEANDAWRGKPPGLSAEWGPSYGQSLGGPNGFLLYQLGLQTGLEYRFSDSTWLSGSVNLRLLDNYAKFTYTAASNLPRVRTFQREFITSSRLTMPLLQFTHLRELGNGQYLSAYAGMLEYMYGGVGAEWLYRPWQGRIAWGVDVNHVRQRDFGQNFAFRDYAVTTGHATMYWDTGWNNTQVNLSVGRYLAGDFGATLDIKRIFSNGVALGAWATKTNVSAAQFGEGSFDKGIYVTIPFDAMLPKSTAGSGTIVWDPLTRDGGARLNRRFALYDLTRLRDRRVLAYRPAGSTTPGTADDTAYVLAEPTPGAIETLGGTTSTLGRQIAGIPAATWLWAGGAVLASSLLDKKADRWALNHQQGRLDRLGSASNLLPGAMLAGAGLLFTGIAGQPAASTAETALTAAAYTLGANLVTRFVVGRARPTEGLGPAEFNGFNAHALKSGFASNHAAVAFALATPFAQQNDMPWLYAVAAASTFGRVQKRDHWVSDTVAGSFMGYAIGSMLTEQQRGDKGVRLSVTPRSVVADWSFN